MHKRRLLHDGHSKSYAAGVWQTKENVRGKKRQCLLRVESRHCNSARACRLSGDDRQKLRRNAAKR
jgi:hypothetical protein